MAYQLKNKPVFLGVPFKDPHTGIQYPANWIRNASPLEKAAIGLVEVPDPAPEPWVAPPRLPAVERRAARYKVETDPILMAVIGYDIELAAGVGSLDEAGIAALEAKKAAKEAEYIEAKAKIRAEEVD